MSPRFALARLLRRGSWNGPRAVFERLEAEAAARGDEGTRGQALWMLGWLEWLAGHWPRALELATAAHGIAEQTQPPRPAVVGRVRGSSRPIWAWSTRRAHRPRRPSPLARRRTTSTPSASACSGGSSWRSVTWSAAGDLLA